MGNGPAQYGHLTLVNLLPGSIDSLWSYPSTLIFKNMDSVQNTTLGLIRVKHPYSIVATFLTAAPIGMLIFLIVFGNFLVIIAVLRDQKLKKQAQNWLIVSLAVADLLVGLLIMPLTLTYQLYDEWTLGSCLCELWLALDVLFVTASILNLAAISLDRYWSLTTPTTYPHRRTPCRMFIMILMVWLSAFTISFPPLVGWRPEGRTAEDCGLSTQLGYVLYSAFGSFYIPVSILLFVYARIYCISQKRKKKTTVPDPPPSSEPKPPFSHRLRKYLTKKHEKNIPNEKKTVSTNLTSSKEDLLNINGSPPQPIHEDYAAVIARVRAIATRRESIWEPEGPCHVTNVGLSHVTNARPCHVTNMGLSHVTNAGSCHVTKPVIEPDAISAGDEISSGDGLSHVMAIAFAAATQSRQATSSDSNTFELQRQLRQRRKLVRRRERQATLVLGLILGSFVVCWLPFFLSYLLSAICCTTPQLIFDIIFWLGYCNSALNPFIYNFANRDFRRAFRRILCDPFHRKWSFVSFSSVAILSQRRTKRHGSLPRQDSTPRIENGRLHRRGLIQMGSLENEN